MDEEVADETTSAAEGGPAAAAGRVGVVVALPREFRARRAVACAVTDVEPALDRAEHENAVRASFEHDVGGLDEVEIVVRPDFHLDDPPAATKGLAQDRRPRHPAPPASRRGRR